MDEALSFLCDMALCAGIFVGLIGLVWSIGFLRVVTVQEATYVAFKQQGGFVYGAMEFAGYHIEPDGTIKPGPGPKSNGSCIWIFRWRGWIFYIWPFVEPVQYSHYNDPNDGFGEGIYVRLGDIPSNPFTSVAETTEIAPDGTDAGNIGVNVMFTSKMRVVNPQLFLFKSPRTVIKEAVEDRQDGVLRAWVFNGNAKHAQASKGNGAFLWNELDQMNLLASFDEARNDWGLDIVKNSIIVKQVDFDPEYENALKAERQQILIAKGEKARIFDPATLAMSDWVEARRNTQSTPPETFEAATARLASTPEYAEHEKEVMELRSKALADKGYAINENKYSVEGGDLSAALAIADAFGLRRPKGNPGKNP